MNWPRTTAGTLRCPCGATGTIFVQVGLETINGKQYGVLGGYCSEECEEFGSAMGHPEPCFDEAPAPAVQAQPTLFG